MYTQVTTRKSRGPRTGARRAWLLSVALIAGLGVLAAPARAGNTKILPKLSLLPFSATKIFIEINATDGDAGLQIFLDAVGWERVRVFDLFGREIADFRARGGVAKQGITEMALESAEPSFEEQPLEDFLERFPAGTYWFLGRTVDGDFLLGLAELTHDLPDGAVITYPEEDGVVSAEGFSVEWEPVTTPGGIEIVAYQVIVERHDPLRVFSVELPSTATSVAIPAEFLEPETEYTVEVLAREVSGNQTISELDFETE